MREVGGAFPLLAETRRERGGAGAGAREGLRQGWGAYRSLRAQQHLSPWSLVRGKGELGAPNLSPSTQ